MLLQLRSYEVLTWYLAHRLKDRFTRDAARLELALDHELPRVHSDRLQGTGDPNSSEDCPLRILSS